MGGDSELDGDELSERVDLSPVGEAWTAESLDAETFETFTYFELCTATGGSTDGNGPQAQPPSAHRRSRSRGGSADPRSRT